MGQMAHRFEIVATLGPASYGLTHQLVEAGATAFRINASHLDAEQIGQMTADVRGAVAGTPVIVDLQGAKMRIGDIAPREVRTGERVRFGGVSGDAIPLPHPELFAALAPGSQFSLDDGRLEFRVERIMSAELSAVCLRGGPLRSRRGVNLAEHPGEASGLSAVDERMLRLLAGSGVRDFALSFVRDGHELDAMRRLASASGVVAKIERREAIAALPAIAARADALWICRGDLGAQLGSVQLGLWVARFDPRCIAAPVLMAGQVFEHLTHHGMPTRSEICHFIDLVLRGYAGIVLSDETAIGTRPVAAVAAVAELAAAVCKAE